MKKKIVTFSILQMISILMAGCGMFGFNPIGMAYFAVMYLISPYKTLTYPIMLISMAYQFDYMSVAKYGMIMLVFSIIISIIETQQIKLNIHITASVIAMTSGLFELASAFMDNSQGPVYLICIGVGLLTYSLTYVLHIAINAIMKSKQMIFSNEEMLCIATGMAIIVYYIIGLNILPESLSIAGSYLIILCSAYKYGISFGAVTGLSMGVVYAIITNDIELLGMAGMAGVLAGGFRKMTRLGSAAAYMSGIIIPAFWYDSALFEMNWLKGMIYAIVIFIAIPQKYMYPYENERNTDYAKSLDNVNKNKCRNLADAFCQLAQVVENTKASNSMSTEEQDINKLIVQDKIEENKRVLVTQFKEVSKIIDGLTQDIYDVSLLTQQEERFIRKCLKEKGIAVHDVLKVKSSVARSEYVVTMRAIKHNSINASVVAQIFTQMTGKPMKMSEASNKYLTKYYCTYTVVEETNFKLLHGVARDKCENMVPSGDTFSVCRMENGQVMLSISDGMGHGKAASEESMSVMSLLEALLEAGFKEDTAIKLINSIYINKSDNEMTASVDMGLVDLYSGMCEFVKMGAATTFIKRGQWIDVIKSTSLPVGAIDCAEVDRVSKKLYDGDYIIMVSDGILDAIGEYQQEEVMIKLIREAYSVRPKELANEILQRAKEYLRNTHGHNDDMLVIVAGMWNK